MISTASDFLFGVEPPWIYVGPGEPERVKWTESAFYSRPGTEGCVRRLRGPKMRTQQALMDEFGAALQFFGGFGANWHALEECLCYLDEWLPAQTYVLVVESAEHVLADDPSELWALLKTLDAAGEWWSRPVIGNGRFDRGPTPFHVLFNLSDGADESRFVKSARQASINVRYREQ
ncbi:MAG: barstar family protein [Rhodoglobus sp.]